MKKLRIQARQGQQRGNSRVYILRLWRADEPQTAEWHASLEDPSTKERFGFSSLEQLFAFLMEQSERGSEMTSWVDHGASS
jgi:hypothetical protein